MNPLTRKLVVGLAKGQWHSSEVPLRRIYVLAPGETAVRLRRIAPGAAAIELLKNTFNDADIGRTRLRRQFRLVTRLAANVPVKRLSYPRKFAALDEICATVVADLASS